MKTDRELLREYAEQRSDAAFAELVRRHLDLVYSTALRLVGEEQMARDVSQSVFIRLARNAESVREGNALPGWLYRAARYEGASAIRSEQRRRKRETEAMKLAELDSDSFSLWTAIAPLLDEAMGKLGRVEQDAVVLRFFQDKSWREVATALGLSEDAVQKRVSRALDTLRAHFERHGVKVASAALGAVLAAYAIQAAPAGIGPSLASVAAASTPAGLLSTLTHTILATKTAAAIAAILVIGAVLTPWLLHRGSAPEMTAAAKPGRPEPPASVQPVLEKAPPSLPAIAPPAAPVRNTLLERVASLPPLSPSQIETYVEQSKRNAESLLAAYRVSTDLAYLTEAATRFPADPNVQYAVIASRTAPETQRQWIEAYKTSSPDNALPWYFSALEYLQAGQTALAVEDLAKATRKAVFRAELAPTLQAVEELNLSAGRAGDEAKLASFQACAQVPHLTQMRELAKAMEAATRQSRQQGDAASAESLAGMGLLLGGHLSVGGGSQTLINQLVGIAIEKMFLSQLDAGGNDPFGRPVAGLLATIEQQQTTLKGFTRTLANLTASLTDAEWANYLERVKLDGEEAALTWLQAAHGTQ